MAWRNKSGIAPLHRRNSSISRFLGLFTAPTNERITTIDAEHITQQERLSRMLHTPKSKATKVASTGLLFDHFLIIGAENISPSDAQQPVILYQYPNIPITLPGICDFCFPNGVSVTFAPSPPDSGKKCQAENSFVFLITTEQANNMYGICVYKDYVLEAAALDSSGKSEAGSASDRCSGGNGWNSYTVPVSPLGGPSRPLLTTKRCYCLISKFPFFRLHFDFLYSLIELETMTLEPDLNKSRSSTKDEGDHGSDSAVLSSPIPSGILEALSSIEDDPTTEETTYMRIKRTLRDSLASASSPPPPIITSYTVYDCIFLAKDDTFIGIVDRYQKQPIPASGDVLNFQCTTTSRSLVFSRPAELEGEEEMLFGEWGVPIALQAIPKRLLYLIMSAVLLEKKIVFISPDVRVLSALVLVWISLIRPFSYQSVMIPILPSSMFSILEAPVPFIVGVAKAPQETPPAETIYVFVNEKMISAHDPIPHIPLVDILKKRVDKVLDKIKFTKNMKWLENKDLQSITIVFYQFFSGLFENFHQHTLRDLTDPTKPITVFLKESFLTSFTPEEEAFLMPFLDTQMFFHFSDERLRRRDTEEIPLTRSQSSPGNLMHSPRY